MKRIIAITLTAAVLCLLMTVPCFAGDGSVDAVLTWGEFINEVTAGVRQELLANVGSIVQGIYSLILGLLTFLVTRSNKKAKTDIETQSTSLSTTAGNIKKAVEDKLKEVITAIEGMTKVVMDKLEAVAEALRENARENRKLRAEVRENNVYWRENMQYSQLPDTIRHEIIKKAEAARAEVLEEVNADEGDDEA